VSGIDPASARPVETASTTSANNVENDFTVRMGLLPPQEITVFLNRRGAFKARLKAFSSEVETGSRQENASNKKLYIFEL
jgi:hypothetical protein